MATDIRTVKIYKGTRTGDTISVTVDGRDLPYCPTHDSRVVPFIWGNKDVGTLQLALSILSDYGVEDAPRLARLFRDEIVQWWEIEWELGSDDIELWMDQHCAAGLACQNSKWTPVGACQLPDVSKVTDLGPKILSNRNYRLQERQQ